ncbi:NADH:ubiquinone oxidoreductase 11.5kD subunit [Saccharata proteae CBS 121410]|uniref:NADH dehydrogenase [ubiquinone] iron-sulfur protein 5 n=1 Tax=Saccharata proteae CBS 121410 TaxID=1314787 RepID=A0A9P4I4U4_9PEZI|nr:NADH:ubiquinone oxidoreductase 11.5kD subunit [Saccharata proteae CBS 121410]
MASGYGLAGGPSRCFPFWQEVMACYMINADENNPKAVGKCQPVLEDYYECLHHKKEHLKTLAMQAAYNKYQAENPRPEGHPSIKEIKTLGLLDATPEEMHIKRGWFPDVKRSVA